MKRIIINNRAEDVISDIVAMNLVSRVIEAGLISEGTNGPQYCFVTSFNITGAITGRNSFTVDVSARRLKSGTDSFIITKGMNRNE